MNNLIKQFIEAREDFLETLGKFPKTKVHEVLFGEWNLKARLLKDKKGNVYEYVFIKKENQRLKI